MEKRSTLPQEMVQQISAETSLSVSFIYINFALKETKYMNVNF